jgi:hypothetical protein
MAFLSTWRNLGRLTSVLLMAMTLSCGGGGGGGHVPEGSLQVINDGTSNMYQLFVTPSTSSTWGVDQLAPDVLPPSGSITLTHLYPGSYDVLASFSDGSADQVFDVSILDGVNTPLYMYNTGTGAVAVYNNSSATINGVYLTPSTASTWGPNQTDQPLYPGQTLNLSGVSPDTYDLQVTFSTGGFTDYRGFLVTAGNTTTVQVD